MNIFGSVSLDSLDGNEDFRCDICNKFLSISPILFHESVGKVCGRCFEKGETERYVDTIFETQTVYEGIAKHIHFPCSFHAKGCKETLEWSQVSQHEDSCGFRDHNCPLGQDIIIEYSHCKWNGNVHNLFFHLKETHGVYFNDMLKMTILDCNNPKDNILISYFKDIPLLALLYITADKKRIFFHLLMDTTFIRCETYTYDLEVSDGMERHKMVFPENRVVPLYERAFTKNCLEHGFHLDILGLQALLRSNCIHLWFKIRSKGSYSVKEESDSLLEQYIFQEKCIMCKNMLFGHIYVCSDGHNICSDCSENDEGVCQCEMDITDDRNTHLENLSNMSVYECKNKNQGCSKLLNCSKLKFHESNCKLTVKKCVMECDWKGNNIEMLNHLKQIHPMTKLNVDYLYDRSNQSDQLFFTVWNEKIFVLSISYDASYKSLKVNVRYLSVEDDRYRFEFSIISGKLKLKCRHYCSRFVYGTVEESKGIIYPFNFLEQFLSEQNRFHFRLNLFT